MRSHPNKQLAFISVVLLMALVLSACGQKAATPAPQAAEAPAAAAEPAAATEAKPAGGKLVFGVVPKITHPFYDEVLAGLEEKTGELDGVEYQWIAPPTGNPAEQVQILEDLINKGVNGIAIAPLEAASVEPVIAQATAAGIPVVTFDSDAPNSKRTAYYGTDNRAAGGQQAEVMAEALGGKGKVAIVTGSLVMANLNERIEGVKAVMAEKYPDIELVDTIATDDDFAKGLDVCEAMLRAYPDLDGVINVSMTGSVAMPKVLADPAFADRGDLVVVGFDDFEDTLKGIRDGYIMATMVQRPKQMGIYVIEGLHALSTGGKAEGIDTGITVVTLDNIDTYKGGAPVAAPVGDLVFGVVPKITHPFYDEVLAGLEEKTAEFDGVKYQWIAPPTGNPAEQVQILEDLINKGVNGIAIAPLEAASVEPVIAQATAAGIPVVTFDSDAPNSKRTAYYGTDNRAAGGQQAEVMAEALGGKGKVAIVTGSLVMANLNERIEGVKAVMAEKYPDIELVDTIATDDDFAKGLDVCEAMLRAYPDLDGVINVSMTGSVAMPKVLADPAFADRGDLVVVGFDDFEDTLKGIRDGYILATLVQRPKQMGIYVIEGLYNLNAGGKAEGIDTGITVVTLDNIDTYKGGAPVAAPVGDLVFGVVPKITHPFYDEVLAGLEEKTAEFDGVKYQWIAPPTGNPAEQVQILEDLINKGVNGIAIAPLEAASVEPVIAQATAAGIPVVTFDSDAPNSKRTAYYGTDNRAAGGQQAEVMAEALGGKGKVAIVTGSLVMANLNERIEGVKAVMAEKYPDIELVDTIATDDDFAKGLDVCEAMLRAYPDLDGVINVSMTGSVAMPKVLADPAFKDRDDLVVVGFDDFEDTLKGIRDGYILATLVQRPKQMGIYVIEGLYNLNAGGKAASIDTGITVVTLDNVDTYK